MALRGGRYETLREIASGGMATVYLGRALGTGGFERLVAIKQMHAHLAQEQEFIAMFLDEARLAACVRHPNVVATIDIQEDEAGLFLVMEYVEGMSLQRLLRALGERQHTLPLDIALRIFLDTLAGLHAAHELTDAEGEPMHLVHRDVSPHNILTGIDGISRITDFGVARAQARLTSTRSGLVKGKLPYLAPEQVRSEPIDRRVDIYAAGVVFWEMLTGERLIWGDSSVEMMQKVAAGGHASPSQVRSAVPESISAACMRALCVAPDDRYPTAAAFAEAIELAAAGERLPIAPPRIVAGTIQRFCPPTRISHPSASAMQFRGSSPSSSSSPRSFGDERIPRSSKSSSMRFAPDQSTSMDSAVSADSVMSSGSGAPAMRTPVSTPPVGTVLDPRLSAPARRLRWGVALGLTAAVIVAGALWFVNGGARVLSGNASYSNVPPPVASSSAVVAAPSLAPPLVDSTQPPAHASPSIAPTADPSAAGAASGKTPKEHARPSQIPPAERPLPSPTSFRPKEL